MIVIDKKNYLKKFSKNNSIVGLKLNITSSDWKDIKKECRDIYSVVRRRKPHKKKAKALTLLGAI